MTRVMVPAVPADGGAHHATKLEPHVRSTISARIKLDFVFPRGVCIVFRVLAGLSGVSGWFCGGVVLPFFFGLAMDMVCLQCVAA